jgi:hypothetical protein
VRIDTDTLTAEQTADVIVAKTGWQKGPPGW